jgi:hypothetical protein
MNTSPQPAQMSKKNFLFRPKDDESYKGYLIKKLSGNNWAVRKFDTRSGQFHHISYANSETHAKQLIDQL